MSPWNLQLSPNKEKIKQPSLSIEDPVRAYLFFEGEGREGFISFLNLFF